MAQQTTLSVVYTGLFITEAGKEQLLKLVETKFGKKYAHHLTLTFKPENGLEGINIGEVKNILVIGQVIDEDLGIQACLVKQDGSIITANKFPHITISSRPGVPAVTSNEAIEKAYRNGNFILFSTPFTLEVIEGYSDGENIITK